MTVRIFSGDSRLADVNVQDVSVAEFAKFMDKMAEEFPAVYAQVIRNASKRLREVGTDVQTQCTCQTCKCHQSSSTE